MSPRLLTTELKLHHQTVITPSGQLFQHARVRTLLGQEIILAGCRVG